MAHVTTYLDEQTEYSTRTDPITEGPIRTGIEKFDGEAGGLEPGTINLLAGRPKTGKSSLATTAALNVAREGTPVHFIMLEYSGRELAEVFLRGIDGNELNFSSRNEDGFSEEENLQTAKGKLRNLPIFVDTHDVGPIDEITEQIKETAREEGTSLVIIDYLQVVAGPEVGSRKEEWKAIFENLQSVVDETNVSVLVVSQLPREVERQESKAPKFPGFTKARRDQRIYRPRIFSL